MLYKKVLFIVLKMIGLYVFIIRNKKSICMSKKVAYQARNRRVEASIPFRLKLFYIFSLKRMNY